jgi:hypothetical protein
VSAEQTATTFRQTCSVCCEISAPIERVWSLLVDAKRFPEWNSTVTSIDGEIALGHKLVLKVPLDPKRTFRPKVTKLVANREMEWSDGFAPMFRGVRSFMLRPVKGATEFTMTEVFSGLMFPMIKGSLPDFVSTFETYAADLKRAAEELPR